MILVAAALALPQIDKYTLGIDSNYSYGYAGAGLESPPMVLKMIEAIQRITPDMLPFFEVLLTGWMRLAGQSVAAARLPAIFFGLLSLALVYRLARDYVAPAAGTFAALILLSNAFFGFYYAYVRFYSLAVLLSALVIWLYLRLAHARRAPRSRDYAALTAACTMSITTHGFAFLLYALLPLYHLLAAPKNRRWPLIAAAALAAPLLAFPLLVTFVNAGSPYMLDMHQARRDDVVALLNAWLTVFTNGSPLLLALSALGALLGWRLKLARANPFWLLFALLPLAIAVSAEATRVVSVGQMRYFLVTVPVVAVFAGAGLYALYRLRKPLALLVLLWVAAGLHFSDNTHWQDWVQGRVDSFQHPPWHLVSRWMRQSNETAPLLTFNIPNKMLVRWTIRPDALKWRYFERHGLEQIDFGLEWFDELVTDRALTEPSLYVLTQPARLTDADYDALDAALSEVNYNACDQVRFPSDTVVTIYRWTSLDCERPSAGAADQE